MAGVLIASCLILSLLPGSQVEAAGLGESCVSATCDATSDIICNFLPRGTEYLCKKKLGEPCSDNSECIFGAACTDDTCQCTDAYVKHFDECRAKIDKPCSTAHECPDNGDCVHDICKCTSEFVKESYICKDKAGGYCSVFSICPENSACLDEICQCADGYKTDSDLCTKLPAKLPEVGLCGATTLAVPGMLLTLSIIVGLSFF